MTTGRVDVRVAAAVLPADLDETNELPEGMETEEPGEDATNDGEGDEE